MLTSLLKHVCAGSFGCVFKGVRGGVQDVAVKVLNISTPDAKERQAFEKARPCRRACEQQTAGDASLAECDRSQAVDPCERGEMMQAIATASCAFLDDDAGHVPVPSS